MRCFFVLIFWVALVTSPGVAGAGQFAAGAKNASAPAYVVAAQLKYRKARKAFSHAERALAQVKQEEARRSRLAIAARGQWIEPRELWRKKQAAEQNLMAARKNAQFAFQNFNRGRDVARLKRVGPLPKPVPLSSPFWWF